MVGRGFETFHQPCGLRIFELICRNTSFYSTTIQDEAAQRLLGLTTWSWRLAHRVQKLHMKTVRIENYLIFGFNLGLVPRHHLLDCLLWY